MGSDREVFWALIALVGAFVAVFGVLLWLQLARREKEERRARTLRSDLPGDADET